MGILEKEIQKNASQLACNVYLYIFLIDLFRKLLKRNPEDYTNYQLLSMAVKIDPFKEQYTEQEIASIVKVLEGINYKK